MNVSEIESDGIENSFINELRSNIQKIDRDYGVEEGLIDDDGDIKFKDDDKFDGYGLGY